MFLAYRFHSFDFVTASIFSKSSVILLIISFAAFFSRNFGTDKFISPKNVKGSNSGSFGLHLKILKACLLFLFHHLSHNFHGFVHQLQ